MSKKDDRINETRVNNNGEEMKIIRYGGVNDIDIQFVKDGVILQHRHYCAFKTGQIKNPMFPSVYGVGFVGVGDYKTCDGNGKNRKRYDTWKGMHERCYDPKYHKKHSTYKDCTVCKEWNNYQMFGKWFDINYYEIGNEQMVLDKDILCKGNKTYSPDTCVFVPQSINKLFTKRDNERGELPIGVSKVGNKFQAQLTRGNGLEYLGVFNTVNEAFLAYKEAKEQYIKEVAEEYKGKIPFKLYQAMLNYKVEIDD